MFDFSADANKTQAFFLKMLEKHGIDEDKWREELNSSPKDQRTMVFTFSTEDVKDGFVAKFSYIFTAVDLVITDQKLLDELEEDNMK